jgi:hypothetical protein
MLAKLDLRKKLRELWGQGVVDFVKALRKVLQPISGPPAMIGKRRWPSVMPEFMRGSQIFETSHPI